MYKRILYYFNNVCLGGASFPSPAHNLYTHVFGVAHRPPLIFYTHVLGVACIRVRACGIMESASDGERESDATGSALSSDEEVCRLRARWSVCVWGEMGVGGDGWGEMGGGDGWGEMGGCV